MFEVPVVELKVGDQPSAMYPSVGRVTFHYLLMVLMPNAGPFSAPQWKNLHPQLNTPQPPQ